ncbi:MAG: hypothetical protein JNL67_01150 [Planctomycetaceae bacterium]|nr:hypothetical protein [Planctomycetaceae bacterium]
MFSSESYNPYAPPTTTTWAALGQHRYYGLVTQALRFSAIYKPSRHPLVWLYWALHPILAMSRQRFTVGVINPATPWDLQVDDLEPRLKVKLNIEHEALESAGFQFAGFYSGPSFGLSKALGEVWFDKHSICLNLVVQVVALRRGKTVSSVQFLYTNHAGGRTIQTTNSAESRFEDPAVDGLQVPGASLADLIVIHRDRLRLDASRLAIESHDVWYLILKLVQHEVQALEKHKLLAPLTNAQLASLIDYSQFIDFRVRQIPTLFQWVFSLKLPIFLALFGLVAVACGESTFRWLLVLAPTWWLLNRLVSPPLFKYWLQTNIYDNLPPFDYFRALRDKG